MDPLTRREAQKIEEVLQQLTVDLETVSFLPDEFSLWLRDGLINTVEKFEARLQAAGGRVDLANEDAAEEHERMCKASGFLYAAACYGDPADIAENEALLQTVEFNDVERDLLENATAVGHVDLEAMVFYRLLLRGLLDTLKDGGYYSKMLEFLAAYYPPPQPSSSESDDSDTEAVRSSHGNPSSPDLNKADDQYDHAEAGKKGMISARVERIAYVVRVLARLMALRHESTVNEDIHRYKVLHEAVNKEQSATADVQALNREYEEVKESRRREVAALDAEIAQLEEELNYVQSAADVELEAFYEVSQKIAEDHRSAYAHQLDLHREAADALEARIKQTQLHHSEQRNELRSMRAKKEAAVSGAIVEYDTQMSNLKTIVEKLQAESEDDTGKIVKLEEQLKKLQTEQREYLWELQIAEQRQEHLNAIRQRLEQSACVVQAYYRAFAAKLLVDKELSKGKKRRRKGHEKRKK